MTLLKKNTILFMINLVLLTSLIVSIGGCIHYRSQKEAAEFGEHLQKTYSDICFSLLKIQRKLKND